MVAKGARLPHPPRCPEDIYSLMLRCWAQDAAHRPTFAQLVHHFSSNSEYGNVQSLVLHAAEESHIIANCSLTEGSSDCLTSDA